MAPGKGLSQNGLSIKSRAKLECHQNHLFFLPFQQQKKGETERFYLPKLLKLINSPRGSMNKVKLVIVNYTFTLLSTDLIKKPIV